MGVLASNSDRVVFNLMAGTIRGFFDERRIINESFQESFLVNLEFSTGNISFS